MVFTYCEASEHPGGDSRRALVGGTNRQVTGTTETVVLSQVDGDVETVQSIQFLLPDGVSIGDCEFIQTSSETAVLAVSDNQNMLISAGSSGHSVNMTINHSFDDMVGKTTYKVTVRHKTTGEVLYTKTFFYVISGISFIRNIDGSPHGVSGAQHQYVISYQDAMGSPFTPENEISVFIQYPDGSSSEDSNTGPFPKQDSLSMTVSSSRAQFVHDPLKCDSKAIGSYKATTGLVLPDGCGYGFYRNIDKGNKLFFGIVYVPHRAGGIKFEISWPGLVASVPALAEEGYSDVFQASITGIPPIVVSDIRYPEGGLFRPEGGQLVTITTYNADIRASSKRDMTVHNASAPFAELPGSYKELEGQSYTQELAFVTEPGFGTNLNYSIGWIIGGGNGTRDTAVIGPDANNFSFSYDPQPIRLDSISPTTASGSGGDTITLVGYFAGFDKSIDGIYFNGQRLPESYYITVSETQITAKLPPRSDLGTSFDFKVAVHVGNANTPTLEFKFIVTEASVIITQSGTTQLPGDDPVYRLGDCTPARFTSVVSPFTSQVQRYEWSLKVSGATGDDLLPTLTNPTVSGGTQTIELQPSHLTVGQTYTLSLKVLMPGAVAEKEITIVRENAVTIGSFILDAPKRSIAAPSTPLRLLAIVQPPADGCFDYNDGHAMKFEWSGFGKTETYSPSNASGDALGNTELVTTPARLGWEFIVPQTDLKVGTHDVSFKVWLESNDLIVGTAKTTVHIEHAPLQAVIRGGEDRISVDANTTVSLTGKNSIDPDAAYSEAEAAKQMQYEWTCLQTTGKIDFSEEGHVTACDNGFLPAGTTAESFDVLPALFATLGDDVKALQYKLIVSKEGRKSLPTSIVLEMSHAATRHPHLTDFSVQVQDAYGEMQDMNEVKYWEPIVVHVSTPVEGVSWTYELVEPQRRTLLSAANLIQTQVYYSPDVSTSISGNRKPLGFAASKLDPYTFYTIKVSFSGSADFEDSEAYVRFRTAQYPSLNFPEPTVMNGTTLTRYTATAGIPQSDAGVAYYFILEDAQGTEFCVGGCTGYSVTYFRIGRVGKYKLSVLLYDSKGTALLSRQTLEKQLEVVAPAEPHDLFEELEILFANGDDSSWTQLAYDLAVELSSGEGDGTTVTTTAAATTTGTTAASTSRSAVATQNESVTSTVATTALDLGDQFRVRQAETVAAKTDKLGDGLRKIICASRPSTGHGSLAMEVVAQLSSLKSVSHSLFYDLAGIAGCCVENTPKGTVMSFEESLLRTVSNMMRIAENSGGSGRRRLLQADVKPDNMPVDLNCWSGKMVTASVTSAKAEGFTKDVLDGKYSMAVVANPEQLPVVEVNGERQFGLSVGSPSDGGMTFYAKGQCALDMYAKNGDEKRFLVLQAMNNFVTESKFQSSPPPGGYASDSLFSVQLYKEGASGGMEQIMITGNQSIDPCFCYKLPIKHLLDELNNDIGTGPSMYSLDNKKTFGVDVERQDEFFNYVVDEFGTLSYKLNDGGNSWVEVCSKSPGFAGSTLSSTRGHAISANNVSLFGNDIVGTAGIVLAGLIVIVVAVVASWVIATKQMAAGAAPPVALAAHELYVERDIYGRGTIFQPKGGAARPSGAMKVPVPET